MSTLFNMIRDINGFNGFGLRFSDTGTQTTLAAGANQSYTVPALTVSSLGYVAIFSYQPGANVFVANNATAVSPSGSFASTVSELNPTARFVKAGDVLSFVTPDTSAYVNVKLYAI